ncbi:endonuclease MutS2 [Luteitalea sp. TBR-22]|uniref:endonuclease MutS2 n=1 Tax=Luteitalea sp. TBR-22 TaxID=2802971 RepID=UPI001AF32C30|nr:Smr/MutS family protein [Luteitalea sp. TBR-22]BCS35622.1 endonuclease MutS2 [Luteitalea sp. TBR-22]
MHAPTLRALEFDQIAAVVRSYAVTPLGAQRLDRLVPSTDPVRVAGALDLTGEALLLLQDHQALPLRGGEAVAAALDGLALQGRPLEPLRLLALADFFDSVDRTVALVERAATRLPALAAVARRAERFADENARVRKAISQHGEVVDEASPALAGIRDKLRRQRQRLRGTLESYLRGRDTVKYLQEQVVTERNGRYVLVVRAEHRGAIPGLVHGASASGASLYLEPLSTVEVNNDIVALEEQEAEEVRRILLALTDGYRARAADLQQTVEAATELDVIQARARCSMSFNGVRPALSHDGRLELRHARHPLLIPAVARRLPESEGRVAREVEPVASDLLVIPPARALVVTGPNTGGKTVALKTAGLLVLMAQAGLFVPAEAGSRLPVFRSVFADIGDEQSIAANLSTFSWHMTSIVAMDKALTLPALVLLDEVGNGTDPIEGGALGVAIIDHFRKRGAVVVATTHYETIKTYATSTEGVTCAAFGFEPGTFAPTYRLIYGSPGGSLAFEIAARLGLPRPVLDAAAAWRSDTEKRVSEQMAKLDRELQSLDHERRLTAQARLQAETAERQLRLREEQLREREAQFTRKLEQRLNEQLRDARAEVDRIVTDLRQQAAALEKKQQKQIAALPTGVVGDLRVSARGALDAVADRVREGGAVAPSAPVMPPPPEATGPLGVGDRVEVGSLRLQGVVRALSGKDADVDVNGKRMRVRTTELRKIGGAGTQAAPAVRVTLAERSGSVGSGGDLNVIGCTVDEAIDRADKFLDQAAMQELRTVRVIHGHGTGKLRQALSGYLNTHPLVLRAAPAPNDMGGSAVTLVELRE